MIQAKKRLDPTQTTLRKLYLASGGVCAMPDCNKRLNQPDGAWIGTVAHIVSAEDGGPRADSSMSAETKRAFSNLMLLCADHGRWIDDRDTGERNFPRSRLEEIKRSHELRFAGLVDQMLESAKPRARSVDDFLDISVGRAVSSENCARFIAYWELNEVPELMAQAQQELADSRRLLMLLSIAARGTLAAMLDMWESTLEPATPGQKDFDDFRHPASVKVHESLVNNRELNAQQLHSALAELEQRSFVSPPWPDDEIQDRTWTVKCPWSSELTGWRRIAEYLDRTQQLSVSTLVHNLDYSIFD
jgi:hypothetical protein